MRKVGKSEANKKFYQQPSGCSLKFVSYLFADFDKFALTKNKLFGESESIYTPNFFATSATGMLLPIFIRKPLTLTTKNHNTRLQEV